MGAPPPLPLRGGAGRAGCPLHVAIDVWGCGEAHTRRRGGRPAELASPALRAAQRMQSDGWWVADVCGGKDGSCGVVRLVMVVVGGGGGACGGVIAAVGLGWVW